MTVSQKSLLKKAEQSLAAARFLSNEGFSSIAVSRAYYAMFYLAKVFLLEKELTFSKHSAVISSFGQHFVKTRIVPEEFHRFLIKGQDRRIVADYDIDNGILSSEAEEIIEMADKFYQFTIDYFNRPDA